MGSYILSGYSSLGIVAYEMAQQLQARGGDVALLAILETNLFARPVRFFVQRVWHHQSGEAHIQGARALLSSLTVPARPAARIRSKRTRLTQAGFDANELCTSPIEFRSVDLIASPNLSRNHLAAQ